VRERMSATRHARSFSPGAFFLGARIHGRLDAAPSSRQRRKAKGHRKRSATRFTAARMAPLTGWAVQEPHEQSTVETSSLAAPPATRSIAVSVRSQMSFIVCLRNVLTARKLS